MLLKIEGSREKLKSSFPVDPRADIEIIFRSNKYRLQMAHLRLYSNYFKKVSLQGGSTLKIVQNFKEKYFQGILSLMYGYTIEALNFEIDSYFEIARFFEIDGLVEQMRKQILENLTNFSVFCIIKTAYNNSDQELFEACCEYLASEDYEQLKYQKSQFFNIDLSLVKVIIKSHKKFRDETRKGLDYIQIDNLLRQYRVLNDLSEDKYHQLKFELFDLNSLNSAEYKHIFLDEMNKDYSRVSFDDSDDHSMCQSTQSTVLKSNATSELRLEMENTFQKKRNSELEKKNNYLQSELQKLKQVACSNQKTYSHMEQEIEKLKNELKKRDSLSENQRTIIKKFEYMFGVMQSQLQKKTVEIDSLVDQFQDFKVACKNSQSINVENNIFVQSQFLPAHLINEIMTPSGSQSFSTKPNSPSPDKQPSRTSSPTMKKQVNRAKYEQMDDEQLQQTYQDRIVFDVEPISIQKKEIPLLCDYVSSNGFSRKKLNLIYRRSRKYGSLGQNEAIRNRSQLLVLINTSFNQHIGGYINESIPKGDNSVSDSQAFIFSLTNDKKYKISPVKAFQAVIIKDSYMLCFANDLLISNDCLNTNSYSFWPNCYTVGEDIDKVDSSLLTGAKQFLINDLQIYEVLEGEMQMIL